MNELIQRKRANTIVMKPDSTEDNDQIRQLVSKMVNKCKQQDKLFEKTGVEEEQLFFNLKKLAAKEFNKLVSKIMKEDV